MIPSILAWVLKHETLVAWGAVIALSLAAVGGVYLAGRHAEATAEAPKLAAAQAQAVTAGAQATVVTTAAKAADHAATRTIQATAKAEEAAHDVQTAPGATDALPADVLARWRAGIDGVRAPPASAPDRAGG